MELFHARNLEDNMAEFLASLGSQPRPVWGGLLKELRIQVEEAAIEDKENQEPSKKRGCRFSDKKDANGKRYKRAALKTLHVQADESAVSKERNVNRMNKKEKVTTEGGPLHSSTESCIFGEGDASAKESVSSEVNTTDISVRQYFSQGVDGIVSPGSSTG